MLQIRDRHIVSIKWQKISLMLHLKAVDDVVRFRVRGSSFHNTAALWLTDLSPAEVDDWAITESAERRCSACTVRVWLNRDHISLQPTWWHVLHWLPVRSRVQFKLCTLMHAIHNQRSSSYLSDTAQTVATATTRCGLRSSATRLMYGHK